MDVLKKIAERKIEEAMRAGEFEGLSGAGAPLALEDDSFVPADLRLAYKVLKNAGFTPPEIDLKKEILSLKELMNTLDDDTKRLAKLRELNLKLMNLSVLLKRPLHLEEYEDRVIEKFIK
jgi:hypothetical protein